MQLLKQEAGQCGLPTFIYNDYSLSIIKSTEEKKPSSSGLVHYHKKDRFIALQSELKHVPDDCIVLELNNKGLTDEMVCLLTTLLPRWRFLRKINLSHNELSQDALTCLLQALAQPSGHHVLWVDLSYNHIFFEGAYAEITLRPLLKKTCLKQLDLSVNFIQKGHLPRNVAGEFYYRKAHDAKAAGLLDVKRAYCEDLLSSLPFVSDYKGQSVASLLVDEAKEKDNAGIYAGKEQGYALIALMAFKPSVTGIREHAFLMLEWISGNGQRTLLRCDLVTPDKERIVIRLHYFSPQDYLEYRKRHQYFYYRFARTTKDGFDKLLANFVKDQNRQGFKRYEKLPCGTRPNVHNCLTWAIEHLEKVGVLDP